MAAERVGTQQAQVRREDQGPDADAERLAAARVREPERVPEVVREHEEERNREVEEIAVDVLEHEREESLAQIRRPRLSNRAVDRVGPHGLVVRAAIVVAGKAETA